LISGFVLGKTSSIANFEACCEIDSFRFFIYWKRLAKTEMAESSGQKAVLLDVLDISVSMVTDYRKRKPTLSAELLAVLPLTPGCHCKSHRV